MIFMLSELWSLQNPFVFHSSTLTLLPLYLSICWVMRTSMSIIVLMWFWAWIIRRYYECVFLFSEKGYCKNFMFEFLYFHQFFHMKIESHYFFIQNDKLVGNERIYFKFLNKLIFSHFNKIISRIQIDMIKCYSK